MNLKIKQLSKTTLLLLLIASVLGIALAQLYFSVEYQHSMHVSIDGTIGVYFDIEGTIPIDATYDWLGFLPDEMKTMYSGDVRSPSGDMQIINEGNLPLNVTFQTYDMPTGWELTSICVPPASSWQDWVQGQQHTLEIGETMQFRMMLTNVNGLVGTSYGFTLTFESSSV